MLSIALVDIDEDDQFEIVVGCEDGQVIVFKEESIMYEVDCSAPVTHLASFGVKSFGFALRNGAFGVYLKNSQVWKEKYKAAIVGMCAVFYDNHPEETCLVIGFQDGVVQVRNQMKGRSAVTDSTHCTDSQSRGVFVCYLQEQLRQHQPRPDDDREERRKGKRIQS